MVILIIKEFLEYILYVASKGREAFSSGDVKIEVYDSEDSFRKEYPSAPEFKDRYSIWEVRK